MRCRDGDTGVAIDEIEARRGDTHANGGVDIHGAHRCCPDVEVRIEAAIAAVGVEGGERRIDAFERGRIRPRADRGLVHASEGIFEFARQQRAVITRERKVHETFVVGTRGAVVSAKTPVQAIVQ
jgi:hypothetical protein